jgi:SAM-dependent methyltransferase
MLAAVKRRLRKFNLKARPSKTYLFQLLESDMERIGECERAADIASNNFKNREFFHCDTYFGVDINAEDLRDGLNGLDPDSTRYAYVVGSIEKDELSEVLSDDVRHVAVEGDMRDALLPRDSLDLVVSTHSLGHVPSTDHRSVITNLVRYLRPGGHLLLQIGQAE